MVVCESLLCIPFGMVIPLIFSPSLVYMQHDKKGDEQRSGISTYGHDQHNNFGDKNSLSNLYYSVCCVHVHCEKERSPFVVY